VLKFHINHVCFHGAEASENLAGKLEQEEKEEEERTELNKKRM